MKFSQTRLAELAAFIETQGMLSVGTKAPARVTDAYSDLANLIAVARSYPWDDDPLGIREAVCTIAAGAGIIGYNGLAVDGHREPPAGHWTWPFFQEGRLRAAADAKALAVAKVQKIDCDSVSAAQVLASAGSVVVDHIAPTLRPTEQERRSPSYEALLLIAHSVTGALARAGVLECDDPGEAIDVIRERLEARLASMTLAAATPPQHPDDLAVDRFAVAMKAKLAAARAKGRGGWEDKTDCTQQILSDMLRAHVEKGDPRDVANFSMFLHERGEAISAAAERMFYVVGEEVMSDTLTDIVAQAIHHELLEPDGTAFLEEWVRVRRWHAGPADDDRLALADGAQL